MPLLLPFGSEHTTTATENGAEMMTEERQGKVRQAVPEINGADPYVDPDERDEAILDDRAAALDMVEGPRVGDFVRFSDWTMRRVSHVWDFGDGDDVLVQTSDGGSFYLGHGYVSFSGGLCPPIPASTLTLTDEQAMGAVWFFHHDHRRASNGVQASVPFRVFTCTMAANR